MSWATIELISRRNNKPKALLITQCPDRMRWYANLVGKTVPFLGDMGNEYKSREPTGHTNFVQYADAIIVETKT